MHIAPGQTRIGWIGTGVMGVSLCGHLLAAGFSATVHNHTRTKAEPLLRRGARWADDPRAVAEASDVIFTMVGYPAEVREAVLGQRRRAGRLPARRHSGRHDDERAIAGG